MTQDHIVLNEYTRFPDAGASSGLSRTSKEVMTTVQGIICLLNIKRNIF